MRTIKKYRKRKKLTQAELAAAIGLKSLQTIYRYEAGTQSMTLERLKQIAQVLDVTVADLIEDSDPSQQQLAQHHNGDLHQAEGRY